MFLFFQVKNGDSSVLELTGRHCPSRYCHVLSISGSSAHFVFAQMSVKIIPRIFNSPDDNGELRQCPSTWGEGGKLEIFFRIISTASTTL